MSRLIQLREDFKHAECAVGYANLGMVNDALEELEHLSPSMAADGGVMEFKLRLLERGRRRDLLG